MKLKYTGLALMLVAALASGCKKTEEVFEDPYAGGTPALGIVVNRQQVPVPASGDAGTEVTINVTGAKKYHDDGSLHFLFNGEEADIVGVTESTATVKVPGRASSGVTAFVVNGQLVFGPDFTVIGKVKKDFTYKVVNGTNGPIYNVVELNTGNILFLGDFTNYDNKGVVRPIYRIARSLPDGTYDRSLQSGTGANGALFDMAVLNSKWYIAGRFSGYAQRDGISNIARTSTSGVIDTIPVLTYEKRTKFVSDFNGGTDGTITHVYPWNGKLVVTGDFRYYLSRRYDQPSYLYKDSTIVDSIDVRQLARLNPDGSLDKTWRFDPNAIGYKGLPGKSLPGGNGGLETLMHADGKILAWGAFTTFDDANVGRIIRLNADGTIDNTFNPGGAGADDVIFEVSYNAQLNKYLAVGRFKTYNGSGFKNMVLLNYDGTIDQSFVPKVFEGDIPVYCKLLDDGLGIISGGFKSYDGTARNGFLITNISGELAEGYNTVGNLSGVLNDVLETRSADNKRALLLVGSFYLFDNQPNNNMIRVTLED